MRTAFIVFLTFLNLIMFISYFVPRLAQKRMELLSKVVIKEAHNDQKDEKLDANSYHQNKENDETLDIKSYHQNREKNRMKRNHQKESGKDKKKTQNLDKWDTEFLEQYNESSYSKRKNIRYHPVKELLPGIVKEPCTSGHPWDPNPTTCGEMHLPIKLRGNITKDCWPRIVLLPSHPVSGNGLTRELYTNITGLVSTKLIRRECSIRKNVSLLFNLGRNDWDVMSDTKVICDDGALVPIEGRVALTKTHYPGGGKNQFKEFHKSFIEGHSNELVTHLVRLVRNPGDHIVRKMLKGPRTAIDDEDCEFVLEKAMRSWRFFHVFWSKTFDPDIPRMILNYEKITNKTIAPGAIRQLLEFVDEKESEEGTLEEKVRQIVVEPKYEHGAILTECCGVAVSRLVHEYTKDLTDEMGYGFDEELGKWYLMP